MAIMASWSDKQWMVSPTKIVALEGISAGMELDTENSDDKAGSPATVTKAMKLQSFQLEFKVASIAGCDAREEYESWCERIGVYAPFYLGGKLFGPKELQLTAVNMSNGVLRDDGKILSCTISITLKEYAEEASGKKATASVVGETQAPGIAESTGSLGTVSSAAGIGASSDDKAAKKASVR